MASVRIEDEAFSDERYDDLAALAGLADADHARGKMARIWRQCTLECTHVIHRVTAERILGPRAIDALVGSRLAEKIDENTVRIRGTEGRIEWLQKVRGNGRFGKLGGRPRNPDKPTRVSRSKPSETPLTLTPALTPSPEREETRSPEPEPTLPSKPLPEISPDRSRSPEIQKEISWAWNYAAVEFGKLVADGIPGAARGAWGGAPGPAYPPMSALIGIVDQLAIAHRHDAGAIRAKVKNRVDVAIGEARKKNDAQFVVPARMWNPGSFAIAADLDPRGANGPRVMRAALPASFYPDAEPPPASGSGGKP